jgi:hypothetical protein
MAVADCLAVRPPAGVCFSRCVDRFFHAGNQDRAAYRVRPGDGQGGVRRPAQRTPQIDGSYHVGFEAAGQHIGLVPGGGPQGMTSPVAYWHAPDIEAKLPEMTAAVPP